MIPTISVFFSDFTSHDHLSDPPHCCKCHYVILFWCLSSISVCVYKRSVCLYGGFLSGSVVKNLPEMQETQVRSLVRKIPWRRKWQLTPILSPGKFHGQKHLVDCTTWGHKELDISEHTYTHTHSTWILKEKQAIPSKKCAEDLNRHFSTKTYRWPIGTQKDVQCL